jgi:hypothetical protein
LSLIAYRAAYPRGAINQVSEAQVSVGCLLRILVVTTTCLLEILEEGN